MIKSLYIHIPFCNHICSYCDFAKGYYKKEIKEAYLKELKKELDSYNINEPLKTIYIGGGTPSSLTKKELKLLFSYLKELKLEKEYEFTFECNIEDINEQLLIFLKENKVNRLSIGVQSFSKKIENLLGRKHVSNKKQKILLAKKYFNNISLDLIYGINGQTKKDLTEDLNIFLSLDIPHISTYALILEEHTILYLNKYQELEEEKVSDMYKLITKTLKNNGYNHYEISNFAKKGYESKHNLTYWNNEMYYGIGIGASGYINNKRYSNTKSINNYLNGKYQIYEEIINDKLNMEYEMILNLRLKKGISKNKFYKKYNKEIKDIFDVKNLKENKNYYYIPENKFFISNLILKDFVGLDD